MHQPRPDSLHYEFRSKVTHVLRSIVWATMTLNVLCLAFFVETGDLLRAAANLTAACACALALYITHRYGYSVVIREHNGPT